MRRTLISDLPRSSDAAADPAPASGVEEGPDDFGRWLTHDLRPKGTPSQLPIAERPTEPPSLVIPAPEQTELAGWLLRDLRPRSSAPPDAGVRLDSLPPSSPGSSAALLPADALAPLDALQPPDSLVPHAVSEAPLTLSAPPDATLDADDLAVLPSRAGRRGEQRRRRALMLLAALLGVGGLVFWRGSGLQADAAHEAEPVSNAALAAAPLPPPPPPLQDDATEEAIAPAMSTAAPSHRSSAPLEPAAEAEEAARRRRAGEAVARFADLPLATQSKLAREERLKARAHDASARARKAASSSRP